MSGPSQRVILCEGFHDRAFLSGWLKRLGCHDARRGGGAALDPWGKRVQGGQFAFLSPDGGFVRVVPCHGDRARIVGESVPVFLAQSAVNPVRDLVVVLDADTAAGEEPPLGPTRDSLRSMLAREGIEAREGTGGAFETAGGTRIGSVLWWTAEAPSPALPDKQTLERLVSAALQDRFPERAGAIAAWLAARPGAASASAKAHAWSHMAGWFADSGCDGFYEAVWSDAVGAPAALEARLRQTGAWSVLTGVVA